MSFRPTFGLLCFQRFLLNKPIVHGVRKYPMIVVKSNFVTFGAPCSGLNIVAPAYCQCMQTRNYAKSKDKKKSDAKGKKKVQINDEELSQIIQLDGLKTQMQKQLDVLKDEFVKNLSIRSSSGAIESLRVKLDGQDLSLQELAQIARKNPKTIVINMSTFPQAIPAVLQAIQKSGMNLNPQQDGTTIFVPVPMVTREHRENLARNAKALFVKCRDAVRDVQQKFVRNVKKKSDVSEDVAYDVQQQIVAIGDQYIQQAEKMLEAKHLELLGKD